MKKTEVLCLCCTIKALINNQKQSHLLIEGMGAVCVPPGLPKLRPAEVPRTDSSVCLT
jgi:hypothetical protein